MTPQRRAIVSYLRIQKYTLGHVNLTCDAAYEKRIFALRTLGFGDFEAKLRFCVSRVTAEPWATLADFLEKAEDSIALHAIRAVSHDDLLEWALPLVLGKKAPHAN